MTLTTRQYELLTLVLETDGFITMSSLAKCLKISTRTAQREIHAIKACLDTDGRFIEVKSGNGIHFSGNTENRTRLKKMVCLKQLRPVYSQEQRVAAILLDLLMAKEPKKIYSFTRSLGITETTVGSDLKHCEKWLLNNNIHLVRKPGVGIYVQADEWLRRRALIRLYYEQTAERNGNGSSYKLPFEKLPNTFDTRGLFHPERLERIERMLDETHILDGMIQSDRVRKSLAVHLYLVLLRVHQGAGIELGDNQTLSDERTSELVDALIAALESNFAVKIPQGERAYLTMTLRSVQGLRCIPDSEAKQQAERIAKCMIMHAEACTGVMIDPSGGFSEALRKHLIPTIARLSMGLDIRNPILNDVKTHYSALYEVARECASVLEEELHVEVPESEIGYLAIHLGVAIEDSRSHYSRCCRAVVCCPSGMVTAQLLALRINREFSDIETVSVVSTSNLDYTQLEKNNIDMIVSTVELPASHIPSVQVSPFLTDTEKDAVWQLLKDCKREPHHPQAYVRLADLKATLSATRNVIDTILQVLFNLFVWENDNVMDIVSVIDSVAVYTADISDHVSQVKSDLLEREKFGSTIIADCRTMLLHCCSNGVKQAWFGVIRPKAFTYSHRNQAIELETILVMLAPGNATKQSLETLGVISSEIVKNASFVETLHSGNRRSCYDAVEKLLNAYYCKIIKR